MAVTNKQFVAVHREAAFYRRLVPAPNRDHINTGLTPASHSNMLKKFNGPPGQKTRNCSQPTNPKVTRLTKTVTISPYLRCTGLKPFLDLIAEVFEEIKGVYPELYPLITTAGCLCCRLVRKSDFFFSNHSWGTAIDLKIAGILSPQGSGLIPQGLLTIYPLFYKRKIYWAQGYKKLTDPMHFEASNELINEWDLKGLI